MATNIDEKIDEKMDNQTAMTTPVFAGSWRKRLTVPILIYLISLGAYLGASNTRLRKHSDDNHYVYLADCLLHGRLALAGSPPHENDWSLVHELTLSDGRTVRGTFLQTGKTSGWFKTTKGQRLDISQEQIVKRSYTYYVSFPWFPALLMLPFVAIWKLNFNDVLFTVLLAAFNPVLVYLVLQRLRRLKLSELSAVDELWLTALFAIGTVHYFSSVLGQVWFTAHVIGTALTALYLLTSLEGRHPAWAGLFLGLGFVTRAPIIFLFPFAGLEILRRYQKPSNQLADENKMSNPPTHISPWPTVKLLKSYFQNLDWAPAIRSLVAFAIPIMIIGAIAAIFNYRRFDQPFEFGHSYLNVVWLERIQRWGLFNYHFLPRNLAVMFALLPKIMVKPPYMQISYHGLSVFFTTPLLLAAIWPRRASAIQPWLWLAILLTMVSHLLYQNSGWIQFGYRFLLDYLVLLIALLAVSRYRLGKLAKALIIWSIIINTFGAFTFGQHWQFYWDGMFPVD